MIMLSNFSIVLSPWGNLSHLLLLICTHQECNESHISIQYNFKLTVFSLAVILTIQCNITRFVYSIDDAVTKYRLKFSSKDQELAFIILNHVYHVGVSLRLVQKNCNSYSLWYFFVHQPFQLQIMFFWVSLSSKNWNWSCGALILCWPTHSSCTRFLAYKQDCHRWPVYLLCLQCATSWAE